VDVDVDVVVIVGLLSGCLDWCMYDTVSWAYDGVFVKVDGGARISCVYTVGLIN
jgi:hypothetical protein